MKSFGKLLRTYRLRSFSSGSQRALSQEQLANLLAQNVGIDSLSGSTISNWERDKYQIHKDDRVLLIGLIKVLHHHGGILSANAADEFLLKGNYRPLNLQERHSINPKWVDLGKLQTEHRDLEAEVQFSDDSTNLFEGNNNVDTITGLLLEIRENMTDAEQLKNTLAKIEKQRLESIIKLSHTQRSVLEAIPDTPALANDILDRIKKEVPSLSEARTKELYLRLHELRYLGLINRHKNSGGKWLYWREAT